MNKLIWLLILIIELVIGVPVLAQEPVDLGDPVGYIEIPSLGFYRPVYSITDEATQMDALGYDLGRVGHLAETPWIRSTTGRIVLVGHTPGAFEVLHSIKVGDEIYIQDDQSLVVYVVTKTYQAKVYCDLCDDQTADPTLLLITCTYTGPDERWLVEAIPSTQTP